MSNMTSDSIRDYFLELPALEPPENVTWNPENPPSNPGMALGIMVPCLTVTTLLTLLRLYVKTFIVRKWHIEDWLLPVAFLFSAAQYSAALHVYTYAPVVHQWDMTLRTVSKFLLDFHVGAIFYDLTIMMLKICILLQFLRIFVPAGEKRKTYWATHILIWMNTLFYAVTVFVEIFACKPMRKQWDPLITGGKCVNTPAAYLTSQSFNLALDLIILIWTQTIIWSLHMSIQQKLKLGVLFTAGLSACIFGACSVWINVEIFRTTDQAYWAAWMALFTFPETTSGFLILCLPVVPRFVKHTQAKMFPSTTKSTTGPPSGRGRTFEEGGKRPRDSDGRAAPRSWWHITAASLGSTFSSLGSKLTGTTFTHNGTTRNSRAFSKKDESRMDISFMSFGPEPDLSLRMPSEDHGGSQFGGNTQKYAGVHVHGQGDDRIYRHGSEIELDEMAQRPKQGGHSHV